ncbi:hypothetical protein EOK75_17225 (plasmid) [Pseudorhodobacter turbinis]|uniref:Uncharacterized protein n=1 Tax=Pseudorhodobacter turbinis TaxID=2500533 RepID=A0A4P8EL02_9RHOB|nr:hypothetical protein [Pseudorhodobacter turbinis]QCO57455.1 hypothetical protein EOK75_17225 [Pseudorhodobacter turbinis]
MKYPIKVSFLARTGTTNSYHEVEYTYEESFNTGGRPATVSFKDSLQGNISVSGDRQYLYVRKNPLTATVVNGTRLTMPGVSSSIFEVIAVDSRLTDRAELMFLIDRLEQE